MRLFLAVDLPNDLKTYLASLKLPKAEGKTSWVKPGLMHITLKFLGEIADGRTNDLISRLNSVAFQSFNLVLNHLGFFPSASHPKILWVNFIDAVALKKLSDKINAALPEFKDNHLFSDHVTLARLKQISEADGKTIVEASQKCVLEKKEFYVDSFVLYKSVLLSSGPEYSVLKRFSCRVS